MAGAGMAGAAAPSAGQLEQHNWRCYSDAPQFARKRDPSSRVSCSVPPRFGRFSRLRHLHHRYPLLLWLGRSGRGLVGGSAIMFGSKGVGGTKYQIAAMVLTYAAISLAIFHPHRQAIEHGDRRRLGRHGTPTRSVGNRLAVLELRSRFGILGLVILFVGLRIAARVTAAKRQAARV